MRKTCRVPARRDEALVTHGAHPLGLAPAFAGARPGVVTRPMPVAGVVEARHALADAGRPVPAGLTRAVPAAQAAPVAGPAVVADHGHGRGDGGWGGGRAEVDDDGPVGFVGGIAPHVQDKPVVDGRIVRGAELRAGLVVVAHFALASPAGTRRGRYARGIRALLGVHRGRGWDAPPPPPPPPQYKPLTHIAHVNLGGPKTFHVGAAIPCEQVISKLQT